MYVIKKKLFFFADLNFKCVGGHRVQESRHKYGTNEADAKESLFLGTGFRFILAQIPQDDNIWEIIITYNWRACMYDPGKG